MQTPFHPVFQTDRIEVWLSLAKLGGVLVELKSFEDKLICVRVLSLDTRCACARYFAASVLFFFCDA